MSNPINVVQTRSFLCEGRDPFPAELHGIIFSYLDTSSAANLFRISDEISASLENIKQIWDRRVEQEELEDSACQARGFHPKLINIFRAQGLSLCYLPIFNLDGLNKNNIDPLLQQEMTGKGSSVLRFESSEGHLGVAFNVECYVNGSLMMPWGPDDQDVARPFEKVKGVVNVLTWGNLPHHWDFRVKTSFLMQSVYSEVHRPSHTADALEACPTCDPLFKNEGGEGCLDWAAGIIAKEDPVFRLVGNIKMVTNPLPLPLPPPELLPSPPLPTPFQKLTERLSTLFASLRLAFAAGIAFLTSFCCRREH